MQHADVWEVPVGPRQLVLTTCEGLQHTRLLRASVALKELGAAERAAPTGAAGLHCLRRPLKQARQMEAVAAVCGRDVSWAGRTDPIEANAALRVFHGLGACDEHLGGD